jgi:hypothetical protein
MPAFPVSHAPLKQSDLKDTNLSALNQQIRQLVEAVNALQGLNGNISVGGNLDLQHKYKVINSA